MPHLSEAHRRAMFLAADLVSALPADFEAVVVEQRPRTVTREGRTIAVDDSTFLARRTASLRRMAPASVPDLGHVLAVFAHPDDESLAAGGLLARPGRHRSPYVGGHRDLGSRHAAAPGELADAARLLGAGEPRLLGTATSGSPSRRPADRGSWTRRSRTSSPTWWRSSRSSRRRCW